MMNNRDSINNQFYSDNLSPKYRNTLLTNTAFESRPHKLRPQISLKLKLSCWCVRVWAASKRITDFLNCFASRRVYTFSDLCFQRLYFSFYNITYIILILINLSLPHISLTNHILWNQQTVYHVNRETESYLMTQNNVWFWFYI